MSFAHVHTQVLFLRMRYFQTVETTGITHNTHSSNIPRAFTIRRTTMILVSSTKLQTNYVTYQSSFSIVHVNIRMYRMD